MARSWVDEARLPADMDRVASLREHAFARMPKAWLTRVQRMLDPITNREDGEDGFDRASRTEQVTDAGFG